MTEVTLTSGSGNGAFIYSSSPGTNNGTHSSLYVGDNGSGVKYRSVVKCPLNELPDGIGSIDSAVLQLYLATAPATSRTMSVYQLYKNWTESGVTWNSYASGSSWSTAGAFSGSDCNLTASGSIAISSSAPAGYKDVALDPTTIYNMYKGVYPNYGFLLKMATESGDRATFNSDNATNKPLLVVNYTLGGFNRRLQVMLFT